MYIVKWYNATNRCSASTSSTYPSFPSQAILVSPASLTTLNPSCIINHTLGCTLASPIPWFSPTFIFSVIQSRIFTHLDSRLQSCLKKKIMLLSVSKLSAGCNLMFTGNLHIRPGKWGRKLNSYWKPDLWNNWVFKSVIQTESSQKSKFY